MKEHFECGCKEGFECLLNEQFSTCEEEDNPEKTVEVVTKHLESQMFDMTGEGDKVVMKWNFVSMGSLGVLWWDRHGRSHGWLTQIFQSTISFGGNLSKKHTRSMSKKNSIWLSQKCFFPERQFTISSRKLVITECPKTTQ